MRPVTVHIWWRPWVYGWTALLVVVVLSVVFLPWWWWVIVMAAGFGIPEGIAIWRQPSSTPPLTSIIRRYAPPWAAYGVFGYLVAGIPAYLIAGPFYGLVIGFAAGLGFWWIEHIGSTFERPTPR
jgi:hypothetical protein